MAIGAAHTSNLSASSSLRLALQMIQREATRTRTEIASGSVADAGLSLGVSVARSFSLRAEQARADAHVAANDALSGMLTASQNALDTIRGSVDKFQSALLNAQTAGGDRAVLVSAAKDALQTLTASLNTTYAGQSLFAGQALDQQPLKDFFSMPASPARTQINSSFAATFGMSQSDPNVSSISAGAMNSYHDGAFDAQFQSPQWQQNWSNASDAAFRVRIADGESIDVSTSANAAPFRALAKAFSAISELGTASLSAESYSALLGKVSQTLGQGLASLTQAQASLGSVQQRVSAATDGLKARSDGITAALGNLEGIDTYAASTRLTALQTQIETSYALTARMQNISLLKYL